MNWHRIFNGFRRITTVIAPLPPVALATPRPQHNIPIDDTQQQSELANWCHKYRFDKYIDVLKTEGQIDDPADFAYLNETEIDELADLLGLKFGRRARFIAMVNKEIIASKGVAIDEDAPGGNGDDEKQSAEQSVVPAKSESALRRNGYTFKDKYDYCILREKYRTTHQETIHLPPIAQ